MRVELVLASLAVALPTISVLVGILLSQSGYSKLDVRLGQIEGRLDARISSVKTELDARLSSVKTALDARLSSVKSELDARISTLDNRFHSDMEHVIGKLTELEVRVARLEEKQTR